MKLCKDCKYYNAGLFRWSTYDCYHPALVHRVDGKPGYAAFLRMHGGACGYEGRHWEPKNEGTEVPLKA